MIGVQDEEHIERARQPRIGLVLELGHLVHHPQEVPRVAKVVVGVYIGLAHVVAEGERRQRGHLREQADDLDCAHLLVVDLVRVGVERRQCPHRGHQHPHRVGVVAEALHEVLHVLVHERVDRDLVNPLIQLRLRGQLTVDQEVGHLEVGRLLAELLDRVAAVFEDARLAIDVGDRAATRRRVGVRRVIRHQAEVRLVGLDLAQIHRAHGAIGDRQLVRLAGAVVGDAQRLIGACAVGCVLHSLPMCARLRLGAHLFSCPTRVNGSFLHRSDSRRWPGADSRAGWLPLGGSKRARSGARVRRACAW